VNDNHPSPFDHCLVANQPVTLFRQPDHPERDYAAHPPYQPEPRKTPRQVLHDAGWSMIIGGLVGWGVIGLLACAVAVACGVAG
jgi:hypothetical protein